jgi:hypothetical protein
MTDGDSVPSSQGVNSIFTIYLVIYNYIKQEYFKQISKIIKLIYPLRLIFNVLRDTNSTIWWSFSKSFGWTNFIRYFIKICFIFRRYILTWSFYKNLIIFLKRLAIWFTVGKNLMIILYIQLVHFVSLN